jgi:hypothetical protein
MRISKLSVGAAVVLAGVSLAGSAFAQDAEGGATAGGEVGMTLPGAAGPKAQATTGDTDHEQMIGHFAVGYMGARTVYIMPGQGGAQNSGTIDAPVIGVRYWLDTMLGIDAGIGFSNDSGSHKDDPGSTVDDAALTGFLVHAGVPLALAGGKHFSFQIVPELNVGFASQNWTGAQGSNEEDKRSGTTVQVGARAGGEVQFGFMGLPQLSLQAGVGLYYTTATVKDEHTLGNNKDTHETTKTHIGTSVHGEPWDAFTGNIAALYYF